MLSMHAKGCPSRTRETVIKFGQGGLLDEGSSVSTQDEHGGVRFDLYERPILLPATVIECPGFTLRYDKRFGYGPEIAKRKQQQPGPMLKLADGNYWLFPEVRHFPRVVRMGDDGHAFYGEVTRDLRAFADRAETIQDCFQPLDDSGRVEIDLDVGMQFCIDALAINYRMTKELVAGLGLITNDLIFPIISAVCSWELKCQMAAAMAADLEEQAAANATN